MRGIMRYDGERLVNWRQNSRSDQDASVFVFDMMEPEQRKVDRAVRSFGSQAR